MLPSQGFLFDIVCPLNDSGICNRPFCPFKHNKKDTVSQPDENATVIGQHIIIDKEKNVNIVTKLVMETVGKLLRQTEINEKDVDQEGEHIVEPIIIEKYDPHGNVYSTQSKGESDNIEISYKPTPISELNSKKHLPLIYTPTRPGITNKSKKIRIKSKVVYLPNSLSNKVGDIYVPSSSHRKYEKYSPKGQSTSHTYQPSKILPYKESKCNEISLGSDKVPVENGFYLNLEKEEHSNDNELKSSQDVLPQRRNIISGLGKQSSLKQKQQSSVLLSSIEIIDKQIYTKESVNIPSKHSIDNFKIPKMTSNKNVTEQNSHSNLENNSKFYKKKVDSKSDNKINNSKKIKHKVEKLSSKKITKVNDMIESKKDEILKRPKESSKLSQNNEEGNHRKSRHSLESNPKHKEKSKAHTSDGKVGNNSVVDKTTNFSKTIISTFPKNCVSSTAIETSEGGEKNKNTSPRQIMRQAAKHNSESEVLKDDDSPPRKKKRDNVHKPAVLCDGWIKARENITKTPGKVKISQVPNVSSMLNAKVQLVKKNKKSLREKDNFSHGRYKPPFEEYTPEVVQVSSRSERDKLTFFQRISQNEYIIE